MKKFTFVLMFVTILSMALMINPKKSKAYLEICMGVNNTPDCIAHDNQIVQNLALANASSSPDQSQSDNQPTDTVPILTPTPTVISSTIPANPVSGGQVNTVSILPTVVILGNLTLTIPVGGSYTEFGALAQDSAGNSLPLTVSGTIDTNTLGTYYVVYTATDANGNIGTATRTVDVIPNPNIPVKPTTPSPTPASPVPVSALSQITFDQNIKYGDKGEQVVELQEFLKEVGDYNSFFDGNFGFQTLVGVERFQISNSLKPDGFFGKLSRTIATTILGNILKQVS